MTPDPYRHLEYLPEPEDPRMLTAIDPDAPGYPPEAYGATLEEAEAESEFALQWHSTLSKATIIRCCTLTRTFDRHRESEKKNLCQLQNHRLKPKEIIESAIVDAR